MNYVVFDQNFQQLHHRQMFYLLQGAAEKLLIFYTDIGVMLRKLSSNGVFI